MKKRFSFLTAADAITIVFVLVLSILEGIFFLRIADAGIYLVANTALALFIFFSALHCENKRDRRNLFIGFLHDWYLVPAILFIYTQSSSIAFPIHQRDYDAVLISIDRWMFGTDPTVWISRFAHPLLTEILQLAYSSYYLFFILLFIELYRRNDRKDFFYGGMLIVYGFYLSYIGYLLVPAVGPRFTLHNFFSINEELPGLFFTPLLRAVINSGGGIPADSLHPLAAVHRDAFPSGHTELTLTAIYLAFRTGVKSRWFIAVTGTLLILSTVYMRYHYVIDVLSGIGFFFFTVWSGKYLHCWWNKNRETNFLPT